LLLETSSEINLKVVVGLLYYLQVAHTILGGRDSVACVVTCYGPDGPGIKSW